MNKCLTHLLIFSIFWSCQNQKNATLKEILSDSNPEFQRVLNDPNYEVQIIYGRIVDGELEHEVFGDTTQYYYPASTVKMLAAFAMAEFVSRIHGMSLKANIRIDSSQYYPAEKYDSLFKSPIQINHLIKKIFVYSDNQAYNSIYRALGKDYINELYASLGIPVRVIHQLSEVGYSFTPESNNISHSFELTEEFEDSYVIHNSEYQFANIQTFKSALAPKNQLKGLGYIDKNDSLINEPFDFSPKNYVPLFHLIGALERIARPDLFSENARYKMSESHRQELLSIMALYPRHLPNPVDTLPDNYVKFLMFGDQDEANIPEHITIRNKVGWAYGYLTDVAHIKDSKTDVEFFLAATIHVNDNQVYNDGVYEYKEVGLPFLAELGRIIYQHELSLKK
jgi:hypothetical protein